MRQHYFQCNRPRITERCCNKAKRSLQLSKTARNCLLYTSTTNIHGGWIKTNNSDKSYEITKGKMNDIEVMVYNKNDNNKLDVNKNHLCYKYVRYLFDDGG